MDAFINRILGYDAVDVDLACLAQSENTVDSLRFVCRIPPLVNYNGVDGLGHINARATATSRQQEDSIFRIGVINFI